MRVERIDGVLSIEITRRPTLAFLLLETGERKEISGLTDVRLDAKDVRLSEIFYGKDRRGSELLSVSLEKGEEPLSCRIEEKASGGKRLICGEYKPTPPAVRLSL
ncbi:MAG: hypothetical protein JRD89_04740 [Deltaproteobacteria bacterium]|nr:hypothetical protein [Deltaproteobacteria bacterium]